MIELEGPLGKSDAINQELVSLERELSTLRKNGTIDPFGLYLYGLVLKQKGNDVADKMANKVRTQATLESPPYFTKGDVKILVKHSDNPIKGYRNIIRHSGYVRSSERGTGQRRG